MDFNMQFSLKYLISSVIYVKISVIYSNQAKHFRSHLPSTHVNVYFGCFFFANLPCECLTFGHLRYYALCTQRCAACVVHSLRVISFKHAQLHIAKCFHHFPFGQHRKNVLISLISMFDK